MNLGYAVYKMKDASDGASGVNYGSASSLSRSKFVNRLKLRLSITRIRGFSKV